MITTSQMMLQRIIAYILNFIMVIEWSMIYAKIFLVYHVAIFICEKRQSLA